MSILNSIKLHAKNLVGWKTERKIIVFSVDDYGNVRLDSKAAREALDKAGFIVRDRFDQFDALETPDDLTALFETLRSVKDKHGNYAVFTPFAVPCNINFEKMKQTGFTDYIYEPLPETFNKLKGYDKAFDLWKFGIENRLLVPQFHGREHFNLKLFREKLERKDKDLIESLKNRSLTSISNNDYKTIAYTAAFDFNEIEENEQFENIIEDGLNVFEKVFGKRAVHFNSPGGREHPVIHRYLRNNGIKYIDNPLVKFEHLGEGTYKKVFNYTGKTNFFVQLILVRNCVFEPTYSRGIDWVSFTLKQIEVAFQRRRPAIISSHRVNFCGHIDQLNRAVGINSLRELLHKIVSRWPDVEFLAANELGDIISGSTE